MLVGRCADRDNVWVAELNDSEGSSFDAYGRKSSCGSRLCPHGLKELQRRSQRRLVVARDAFWKHNEREPGKAERFVTLTGPTLQGVSLEDSNRIFNRAFELLSDRAFWAARVCAGAKHVEFTVNERGFHTHIHLLVYGDYLERDTQQEEKSRAWRSERLARLASRNLHVVKDNLPPLGNLQDEWTMCLTLAVAEYGRQIEWNAPANHEGWYSRFPLHDGEVVEVQPTSAGKGNVHVCLVREKGRPSDGEVGLHSAVKELTKYLTKSSSWSDVSDEQLVAIAEVTRWARCFELLGAWRRSKSATSSAGLSPRKVLHIALNESWEDFCRRVALENAHPDSYVIAWDELYARELRSDAGTLYSASSGEIASLDTDFVFRSATESPPSKLGLLRPRSPSLMALGDVMPFEAWLKLVSIRLMCARRTRARLLAKQYAGVRFSCLDGSEFGGTKKSSSRDSAVKLAA